MTDLPQAMFVVTLPQKYEEDPATFAERAKESGADVLEIRGDLTPDVRYFPSPLPLLISPRGTRGKLLHIFRKPLFVDLELHEDLSVDSAIKIIRSFHDYEGTPSLSALRRIVQHMLSVRTDVLKIATTFLKPGDAIILEQLRITLPPEKSSILMGMGEHAGESRLVSPSRNFLTYTCLSGHSASAPGQLPIEAYKKNR
jgi:3-dehydroquinate dehydratase